MFKWGAFLELAERLAQESGDEAAMRSAISRAYYAAYHAAAFFVRAEGLLPSRHTHAAVWAALSASPDRARAGIGQRGTLLKSLRTDADYRNPFRADVALSARQAVDGALALIAALDALG